MNKPNRAEKYEKMDKLGEGTYGVVYKAKGTESVMQIRRLGKSMPSRRSGYRAKKRGSLRLPSARSPSSRS